MRTELAQLDLRLRRRGVIAYGVGVAAYAVLIVVLYPSFKGDQSLDALTSGNPTMAALFGLSGSLTSPDGWLAANLYANVIPLFVLLMTIGYGAACIAGQDEEGRLGLLAALPVSRRNLLLQKALALTVLATPVALVTLAAVLLGRGFELRLALGALLGTTLGVILLGVDFGMLALFVGALTGNRGLALGVASSVAALGYLISSLAPAVHWVHQIRSASPFYWALGDSQLTLGLSMWSGVALAGAALALLFGSLWAFERLDVH